MNPAVYSPLSNTRPIFDSLAIFRAFLAQWVIISHVIPALYPGFSGIPGALAVWCFFIISGYLNYFSFISRYDQKSKLRTITSYYFARIKRLYPLLILSYVVVAYSLKDLSNSDLLTLFPFVFFVQGENMPNNGLLWTLIIELQLYCITPILFGKLFKIPESPSKWLSFSLCSGLLSILVVIAYVVIFKKKSLVDDRTMLSALPLYFLGMMLAHNRRTYACIPRAGLKILGWVLVSGVVFIILSRNIFGFWPHLFLEGRFLPVIACLLVLQPNRFEKLSPHFLKEILLFLGGITYEIYLFHGLFSFILATYFKQTTPIFILGMLWIFPVIVSILYRLISIACPMYLRNMRYSVEQ